MEILRKCTRWEDTSMWFMGHWCKRTVTCIVYCLAKRRAAAHLFLQLSNMQYYYYILCNPLLGQGSRIP